MDEQEHQDNLPTELDDQDVEFSEDEEQEEQPRLYFGRFTPGVWYGGVLGIAMSYMLTGLLGLADGKFGVSTRSLLESPFFKYGLIIGLCFGLGKLGGILEKRRADNEN